MKEQYYSVDQVAQLLDIHPKTIQRYIREGKLRATKIGKAWRVSGHDLSLFTEGNANEPFELEGATEVVKSSSVIDIMIVHREKAYRIINTLNAAMNVKPSEYGEASIASQYIHSEHLLRLTLWGNLPFMIATYQAIENILAQEEE
jgi:excisionase family DNA binding protein